MFLDKEDRVIRPALLWNDQRTARQCAAITERVGEKRLLRIAGNPALTGHLPSGQDCLGTRSLLS